MRTQRMAQFASFPVDSQHVVFPGDSITHEEPWEEMFPLIMTRNRGISGDTTSNVLKRLDQVIDGKPKVVFMKTGDRPPRPAGTPPEEGNGWFAPSKITVTIPYKTIFHGWIVQHRIYRGIQ